MMEIFFYEEFRVKNETILIIHTHLTPYYILNYIHVVYIYASVGDLCELCAFE